MDQFRYSQISEQNKLKKIHFFIKNDELQTTGPDSRAAFAQMPGSVAVMARIYHAGRELNEADRRDIYAS